MTSNMESSPETRYARHGDVSLAYQVVGDGPLNLLFTPSGQFPIDLLWDDPGAARFLRRLASIRRLVLYDARGFGASRTEVKGNAPTGEDWADDHGVVMDAAGMERAALIGFEAGAFFSMSFRAEQVAKGLAG